MKSHQNCPILRVMRISGGGDEPLEDARDEAIEAARTLAPEASFRLRWDRGRAGKMQRLSI